MYQRFYDLIWEEEEYNSLPDSQKANTQPPKVRRTRFLAKSFEASHVSRTTPNSLSYLGRRRSALGSSSIASGQDGLEEARAQAERVKCG